MFESLEGTVTKIIKIGNIDCDLLDFTLGRPERTMPYTLFELSTSNSKKQKVFFPLYLSLQIQGQRVQYIRKDSPFLDGGKIYSLEILEGPYKGVVYNTDIIPEFDQKRALERVLRR